MEIKKTSEKKKGKNRIKKEQKKIIIKKSRHPAGEMDSRGEEEIATAEEAKKKH